MKRNTNLYLKEQHFPLMSCLSKEINYQYSMKSGGGGNKPWSSLLPRFISSFGKLTSKHMTERVGAQQVCQRSLSLDNMSEIIGAVVQGVPPPLPHWRWDRLQLSPWIKDGTGIKGLQQSLSQFHVSGTVCGMKKSKVDLNTWHHFTKHWSSWDGSNISLWWSSEDVRLARGPVGDQKCCWEEKCEEYPTYSGSLLRLLRSGSRETGVLSISCVLGSVELHQMMVQFVTYQVDFVGFLPW